MAIKVPGNPFGVDVQIGSTQEMGLQSAKESEFSARKQFEGLSGTFGKLMEDFQKDIDDTITRDNMLQLNDAMMDALYNEKNGALQQKGKNALDLVEGKSLEERTREELKRRYDTIARGAHNKRQKEAFAKFYQNVDASVQQKIAMHVIKQQGVYEADQTRAETDSLTRMATSGDPELTRSGMVGLIGLAKRVAEKNGIEPDYDAVGDVALINAVQALDRGDIDAAKQIHDEWGKYFTAAHSLKYKTLYDTAKQTRYVDDEAERITTVAKSRAEAIEMVEKLDGKSRDKVRARVRQIYADQDLARRDNANTLETIAYKTINAGQVFPQSELYTLQELNPAAAKRVLKYQQDKAAGKKIDTNWDVYRKLQTLQESDFAKFARIDLDIYAPDLSAQHLKKLKEQQAKAPAKGRRLFVQETVKTAEDYGFNGDDLREIEIAARTLYDDMASSTEGGVLPDKDKAQLQTLLLSKQKIDGQFFDEYGFRVINERDGIFAKKGIVASSDDILRQKIAKRDKTLVRKADLPFTALESGIAKHYALTGTWSQEARALAIKNIRAIKNDPNYEPTDADIDKVCRAAYAMGRFDAIKKQKNPFK